jgi:hypothetical protein
LHSRQLQVQTRENVTVSTSRQGNPASAVTRRRYNRQMHAAEDHILTVAEIVRDAAAMNDAGLARDFDEARFRAQLIVGKSHEAGFHKVALAAAHLLKILGPLGSVPGEGYGSGMLRVADELDKVGFEPL